MVHKSNLKFGPSQLYLIHYVYSTLSNSKGSPNYHDVDKDLKFHNHRFSICSVLINVKLVTMMSMQKFLTSRVLMTEPRFASFDGCIYIYPWFLSNMMPSLYCNHTWTVYSAPFIYLIPED